jgi:hypothetical protein
VRRVETTPGAEGWNGALDDRWHSSDAFRGNYRDEFGEGLALYLQARGFQLTAASDGLDVRVSVDQFEGRKRLRTHGGELRGTLTLVRGGTMVGSKVLFESLSYRDDSQERQLFSRQYNLDKVSFDTVLFYRLAISFYASVVEGILDYATIEPRIE